MAKKYLLYIHDERFEQEQEKSKLVNQLLDNHYDAEHYRKMPTPKNTITITKRYDAFVTPEEVELKNFPGIPDGTKVKLVAGKRCKHGNLLGECFDRKADRSCKP